VGVILIIVAIEATRQSWGIILPIVTIIAILYAFTCQYWPGAFYHSPYSLNYLLSHLSAGFSGMYGGTALGVSANYIFLFIVFGALLQVSGSTGFFMEAGKLAARRLRGGPAQTAVVSSLLVGMVTGSAVANVALTGAFTIPLMKKVGYAPYQAGAIEATASSAGQITPPVMGASAFMMAAITGILYFDIVVASFIPALLYYVAVGCYCEMAARRRGLHPPPEKVDYRLMFSRAPLFFVPLGILVYLLAQYYSPMFAIFWGVLAVVIVSLIRKDTRQPFREWRKGIVEGAVTGAKMAVSVAAIGFIISVFSFTGLGMKLSGMVETWSLGYLWLGAILTMLVSLILGCGMPTLAAYLLVAFMVAPVFVNWGVGLLQAHLFCFYFAVISAVTPPVALAALVGAGMAGAPYFKTAMEAWKISVPAYIVAYALIWNPTLILQPPSLVVGVLTLLAMCLGLLAFASVVNLQFLTRLNLLEVLTVALIAAGSFVYVFTMNYWFLVAGGALFAIFALWQRQRQKAEDTGAIPVPVPTMEG
ncbi:MAG: TRAP transporter fused permease subunit, partial [Chloroflexota bacterium]